ncbi:Spx/MgsR family RNA polymerase-binding regulatory protein [Pseudostreptobacillus hongkongensis]|uniref:Spx/MgsR family RNA polymerase-binding regulatory protein n=1 Tax=Pseudostreptobacillus hongkongensis TaxID=1162717 RepID=UPI000831932A|nr:Spx/MgsR family RNA polymerase-binding regulatory protein [Pseudostreptobacillus hongkongensis]
MKNIFIGYPKCSTCKNAYSKLKELGIELEYRDIANDKLNYDELKHIYEKSGLDIKKFFNTSGQVYRSENIKDKLDKMSIDEKLQLLSTNGMLVKRPILIYNDKILIGYKEKEYLELK